MQKHPGVHINIVTHFTHPDEFLERDAEGNYKKENGHYVWLKPVQQALENMQGLSFVSLENQTPIIRHVNDTVEAQHILHREIAPQAASVSNIFSNAANRRPQGFRGAGRGSLAYP